VLIDIDAALSRNEPDAEIRQLLKASAGLNVALDYLPGSTMFDPAARDTAPSLEASLLVWFDALVLNVDRTPRNANLLVWHRKLYPIDHGAALFFHHNWPSRVSKIESPFMEIEQHILLPWANAIEEAAQSAHRLLTPAMFAEVVGLVPDEFFEAVPDAAISPAERRAGYIDFLTRRLAAAEIFEQEAIRARTRLL
jgi:hypothetical protein